MWFQFSWFLHQFYKLYIFILSNIQRHEFWLFYLQTDRQTDSVLQQIYAILSATWGGRIALAWTGNTQIRSTIYCTNLSISQKLKLLKFCSFRNFTHTPTHAAEYLILIQLNYLNALWNLSILVWCWRTESSFDCPAASFTKLPLALL